MEKIPVIAYRRHGNELQQQVYSTISLNGETIISKLQNSLQLLANPTIWSIKPYQPGKSISEVKKEFGLENIVKLVSNENLMGPSPLALAAVQSLLPEINFYPEDSARELKYALAKRHGVGCESIILGHGATDILEIIARAFLCSGDEVISAHPSFPWFQMLGQANGAKNVVVPLRDHTHDLQAMASSITNKTKLIFIANPNNPTGTMVEPLELNSFLRLLPANLAVVLDEAYIEYATNTETDAWQYLSDKLLIIVRTFSKMAGLAGLRIGYAVAERHIIELLEKARQPFNTTNLAHIAALASLQDHQHIERSRQMVINGKAFLYAQLEKLGVSYVPSEANFVFVDFQQDPGAIFNALLQRGFIIRPVLETCARITIGLPIHNNSLMEALAEVLSEHKIKYRTVRIS
ncbi:MAG: histidinol-phosphate transaminase [Acidobacteriota bacterium]